MKVFPVHVAIATSIWRFRAAIAFSISVFASTWYGRARIRGWSFGKRASFARAASESRDPDLTKDPRHPPSKIRDLPQRSLSDWATHSCHFAAVAFRGRVSAAAGSSSCLARPWQFLQLSSPPEVHPSVEFHNLP